MSDKKHFVYKLSPTSFRVMQEELSVKQTLLYSDVAEPATNSLAYDYDQSTLFFIKSDLNLYYIQSGDTVATEVSGFVSPTAQPANAAYHNGAIWYFEFNSNVLVKLTLTYNSGVPSVTSKNTYEITGMSLPSAGTVGLNTNTFGDIAINNNTGILYASTSRGRFYSINLSNPTATFTEILSSQGNDRDAGFQLAYNNATNVLYAHNHKSGNWYTINTSTGALTNLNLNTGLFRDIAGNSTTMYGNDANGDIYEIDITLSTPSTLDQFFLPKGTVSTESENLEIGIRTEAPDQPFRIGIFETTTEPNVKINWGDNTAATYVAEGYQEHVYEDIIDTNILIQGNIGGGELRIGGKVKPVKIYGTWTNDYSSVDIVKSVSPISGITNISSIEFTNNRELTSVPENLFTNVTSTISNLNNTFENTGLTSIPSGLLVNMSGVTSYFATFRNCSDISGVPIPMLDVHNGISTMASFLDWTIIDNYNEFLDWLYTEASGINLTNITLGACGNIADNSTGLTAFSGLINGLGWTINDNTVGNINSTCFGQTPPPEPPSIVIIGPEPENPDPEATPPGRPAQPFATGYYCIGSPNDVEGFCHEPECFFAEEDFYTWCNTVNGPYATPAECESACCSGVSPDPIDWTNSYTQAPTIPNTSATISGISCSIILEILVSESGGNGNHSYSINSDPTVGFVSGARIVVNNNDNLTFYRNGDKEETGISSYTVRNASNALEVLDTFTLGWSEI